MSGKNNVVQLTYEFYRAVKSATSCVMDGCGTRSNIEFHHVDPSTKLATVSHVARLGTIEELIRELRKCVPLCTAHHRDVHSGRINGWLKGRFDNGKMSHDGEARRYMPFQPYFTGLIRDENRGKRRDFGV